MKIFLVALLPIFFFGCNANEKNKSTSDNNLENEIVYNYPQKIDVLIRDTIIKNLSETAYDSIETIVFYPKVISYKGLVQKGEPKIVRSRYHVSVHILKNRKPIEEWFLIIDKRLKIVHCIKK